MNEIRQEFKFYASFLDKPYEEYSIDELANKYCEAIDLKDEDLKNIYLAALTLRFWYVINKLNMRNSKSPVGRDTCLD